ncbi:MAG: hypothetical protein OEY80_11650 [Nitrospirota bacterium]|nr:hypothetical protein [Nitrospirota bacterium]
MSIIQATYIFVEGLTNCDMMVLSSNSFFLTFPKFAYGLQW